MPMPSTHSARQQDPALFSTCRMKELTSGVAAVVCRRKDNDKWEVQSIRLDADKFSPEEARKWLKDHDFSTTQFEEATGTEAAKARYDDDCDCDEEDEEDCECAETPELLAYSPDQPRDERGRFGGGGGGETGGKEGTARGARARDSERKALERNQAREVTQANAAREKEDRATVRARDREDKQTSSQRNKDDRATERQRDREDRDIQTVRNREDRALERQRAREDKATGLDPKRDEARITETRERYAARDREDAHREAQCDKEDTARNAERDRHDDERAATRDREDAGKQEVRDKLDANREADHQQQRAALHSRHKQAETLERTQKAEEQTRRDVEKERQAERARSAEKIRKASERDRQAREILRRAQSSAEPLLLSASAGLEIMAAASADGPAKVSMLAYTGVPMTLDNFPHPVVVDLESLRPPRQSLPILRGHDPERIAGHSTQVEVTPQRIRVEAVLSGLPQHTDEITYTAGRGFPWQVSIGAALPGGRPELTAAGDTIKINGRWWKGPVLVARGALLREVSLLPMGADSNTEASLEYLPELNGVATEKGSS